MKAEKKHDFSGACIPNGKPGRFSYSTFSLGVFEWVPKAGGNGVKKGPVKVRVIGLVTNEAAVFAKAQEIADALDAGTYSGPKTVNIP